MNALVRRSLTFLVGGLEQAVPRHFAAHRQRQEIVSGLDVDDAVQILLSRRAKDPWRTETFSSRSSPVT